MQLKSVLRVKFIAKTTHIRNKGRSQTCNLSFHLKKLGG